MFCLLVLVPFSLIIEINEYCWHNLKTVSNFYLLNEIWATRALYIYRLIEESSICSLEQINVNNYTSLNTNLFSIKYVVAQIEYCTMLSGWLVKWKRHKYTHGTFLTAINNLWTEYRRFVFSYQVVSSEPTAPMKCIRVLVWELFFVNYPPHDQAAGAPPPGREGSRHIERQRSLTLPNLPQAGGAMRTPRPTHPASITPTLSLMARDVLCLRNSQRIQKA